ncbi:MAG: hypothetical protein HWD62_14080 [Cyclobacteriaceae bacterium]|nr:MAG: hypothetical protein HWD62_14080 [Cyclobacteriaceae bacterium]
MTEQFILDFAPLRLKQQGYSRFHLRHRDFIVEAGATITIPAYNEMFFIVDEPPGLVVDSDYGMFDSTDDLIPECIHIHRAKSKSRTQAIRNEE